MVRRKRSDKPESRAAWERPKTPPKPCRKAAIPVGPKMPGSTFVNANADGSPALKRYLNKHYGGQLKTLADWNDILKAIRTRTIS